ncbi:GT2 family glycosyltransferase|uniref:GT2 family glycosyltransferase n=2 Tax=Enterobacterales TaxID=91347 RepID=A0A366I3D2_9GAMM|nr:glycosyltransferase [Brenneria salicis]NMN91184.1 GT2 family glycosyltransferase [Brenneria salicis ATCC 15712 = DSM 30166]RBP62288.1 GT2 family glycosyltransferase [Brenneria salicis ATCC 15712 = DSM 30166]RLM30533.1 hypothetical protein BHG07_10100 [Brenneria salicis ATCC 15712 = DSM 30166]
MPHVYLSTLQLTDYSDEALATRDVIDAFLARGWQVDVYTHRYTSLLKDDFEQQFGDAPLWISDDEEYQYAGEYDLLWLQYGALSPALLTRLLNGGISGRILFHHLAMQTREEMPPDIQCENRLADNVLVSVSGMKDLLRDSGINEALINVFANPVPERYFVPWRPDEKPVALKKLLLVVDRLDNHFVMLAQALQALGVQCDIKRREQVMPDLPALWNEYDAVIANGRIAQYAVCAGIPVYLYRGHGVLGYLGTGRWEPDLFRAYHQARDLSVDDAAREIVDGYANALASARRSCGEYAVNYRLSEQLSTLLENLAAPSLKTISDQEWQRLTLHNQTLRDKTKPAYSVGKWLDERQITPARRALLQAYIHNQPELGQTAIAIVAGDDESSAAIVNSWQSVQELWQPASEVYLIAAQCPAEIPGDVNWLPADNSGISQINRLVEQTVASFLLILHAGDRLLPQTLLLLAEYRLRHEQALVFYMDEAHWQKGEVVNPVLKPACNIDLLRSYPYIGRNLALSVDSLRRSQGMDVQLGIFGVFDTVWQVIEQVGPQAVAHIPDVLIYTSDSLYDCLSGAELSLAYPQILARHLARCQIQGTIVPGNSAGTWRIQYQHDLQPLVSIIIPTRDHLVLLSECVESLMEKTQYSRYELLLVDNGSTEPGACQFLQRLAEMGLAQIRVLQWHEEFNFSAINNYAATHAHGDVLLFLNNDTVILNGEWLQALLQHALRPEVGIVGAKMTFEDGRIQHGGMVLGLNGSAGIAFQGLDAEAPGYMRLLQVTHDSGAVSAACMMMRRDVFNELGGFDAEQFPAYFGDVDLSLKAQQQGYLTVWTPDAHLRHMGGASRLLARFGVSAMPRIQDIEPLYQRWFAQLVDDPHYHPDFGRNAPGFGLAPDMARCQLPLPGRPLPVVLANHSDWYGCGHYRVMFPFQALEQEMHIEGGLKHGMADVLDVERLSPDVIIAQLAYGPHMPQIVKRYRQYTHAHIVAEFDDYILNIPINSGNRKNFLQERIKNFRRALESVDWVVVSTPALADAYSAYHSDIRVACNRLPVSWWKGLNSLRRQGRKPRIGWAGGSSHRGDLMLLRSVIKELENEVEWVFMGMKPEGIQCEFHAGVPIEYYPQKTASLNLDLALVPLEYNQFNECKSNLRLLELGACGIPVICTDIEPYRCGLPVTRVNNRFKDWMEAIRMHLADMDESEKMGDQLRAEVYRDWMLEGDGLADWQKAWLPA